MGESFAVPHNAATTHTRTLPQPSPLVTEDDDEPPNSGSNSSGQPQVGYKRSTGGSLAFLPATERDGVHNKMDTEKVDVDPANGVDIQVVDRKGTSDKGPSEIDAKELGRQTFDIEQGAGFTRQHGQRPFANFFGRRFKLGRKANKLRTLFTPTRPLGPSPTFTQSLKAAMKYSPLNILLLCIPVSWALHFTDQNPTLIFVFSSLGLVPLAALLGFGTEQIALKTSASVGGLLNATLGNIVEMIIAGIALKQCELELVQSSLLGGLLSNLLLVLGMAFIVGGYRFQQQEFQPMVAQLNSSLLIVSVISLIVPFGFHQYLESRLEPGRELPILLELSRGGSIILILIYFAYLYFQLYSHNHLFLEVDSCSSISKRSSEDSIDSATVRRLSDTGSLSPSITSTTTSDSSDSDDFHTVKLNTWSALGLVLASTGLAYLTAESLVDSLHGLLEAHPNISKEWITLIIIPVISNAAEHVTAVIVASKGKFDLAMSVAVGSCIQIALFVIPVLVLVAWGLGKPLTLLFDPLETLVLFFSVLLVKFSVEDGKSHWMSGLALVSVYVFIALAFWHFPEIHRVLQGSPITCT